MLPETSEPEISKSETPNKGIRQYLHPFPIALIAIALSLAAIGLMATNYYEMDAIALLASLDIPKTTVANLQQGKLKPVILIDVRSQAEYDKDRIGKSSLVPIDEIETGAGAKQVMAIAQAQTKSSQAQPTIVLYCTSGSRSIKAYRELQKTGLHYVILSGGITAWRHVIPATQDASVLSAIQK